jgi:hypothetical protein
MAQAMEYIILLSITYGVTPGNLVKQENRTVLFHIFASCAYTCHFRYQSSILFSSFFSWNDRLCSNC